MSVADQPPKPKRRWYQFSLRTQDAMKRPTTRSVLLVGLLLIAAAPASARKWTSNTGNFSVDAELVEVKDGNVRLKRQDGSVIAVAASKLSKADRAYLASIAKPKPEATRALKTDDAQGNLNENEENARGYGRRLV